MQYLWCLWLILTVCKASPLTLQLEKNGKECVYLDVDSPGCLISYYFAVQEGEHNAFKLRYEVWSPEDPSSPIIFKDDEVQGQWTFSAEAAGEYALCVIGDGHSKIVDLEIVQKCGQETPPRADPRFSEDSMDSALVRSVDDSVQMIDRQLKVLERNLKVYKTRSERNNYTVKSIESRIVLISAAGIILVPATAVVQTVILKFILNRIRV